ncbi:hypothetical protein BH10CYA1_BH10CYA1_33320 [soil metagenome]
MGRSENISLHPPEIGLPPEQKREDFSPSDSPITATTGAALRERPELSLADNRGRSDRPEVSLANNRVRSDIPELTPAVRGSAVALPELVIVQTENAKRELRTVPVTRESGENVVLDSNRQISKISYPSEHKTREFGRDENGEINKLVTTTPRGQFSYVKEDGHWLYLAPDHKKHAAPDFSLDDSGEFSKSTGDGVVLTQRKDGSFLTEERTAIGARIQRDSDGSPRTIKRPDNSMVRASYEDGQLVKLVDGQDGAAVTWKPDGRGNWRSDEVPPQAVQNLRVENNGNLSYTADKVKYTIRGNGAELAESGGISRYAFDDQGRISSIKYPGGKSALSFGYLGSNDKPSFVQVDDLQKHQTKRFIHQPEKGGWTELDRNNNLLGTWKGSVNLNDDGSYGIKPAGGNWLTYLPNGSTRTEHPKPAHNLESKGPETDKTETDKPEISRPKSPESKNENEVTDHSFQLKGYMLPSPDQLGAGSCLYMSATGIAEYLINKSKGIVNPQVGGATDLSEQWTINLSKTVQLGNNYTDAPELLAKAGALPDSRMKFRAYASSSWMNEQAIQGRGTEALPPFKKDVLFNGGGEGSQNAHGQMRPADLERIKKYLRQNESPVLFVYKPPTANWWHANIITGYDDKTQSFTVRDSSFGRQDSKSPAYNYDGRSPYGPKPYRNETQMPYYQVLQWGNHATGYKLSS